MRRTDVQRVRTISIRKPDPDLLAANAGMDDLTQRLPGKIR